MDVSRIKKLLAATLGFVVLIGKDQLGLEIDNAWIDNIVEGVVAAISLFGVFAMRNTKTVEEAETDLHLAKTGEKVAEIKAKADK